jgi:pantoate--beta-alanine ligase
MKVITSIAEMARTSETLRSGYRAIGFVPTMGALHSGHCSLVSRASGVSDVVVMSIFVNPAQFGPREDFTKYPRTFEKDCAMAEAAGCDIVFAPQAKEMYPEHYLTYVMVEELSGTLCGITRPTHFKGVATVVLKFFNIVAPHRAFFGQKDAQQVIVLKRMVRDLNVPVAIEVCPTVRESDGLAMSSRNVYLTPEERHAAPAIYQGLSTAAALFERSEKSAAALKTAVKESIASQMLLSIEYIEIVDTATLLPVTACTSPALVAVACRTGESNTRLIDNIVIGGTL